MHGLAAAYFNAGRKDEALKLQEELRPILRKVYGPKHLNTLSAMNNLATFYSAVGRKDEALKLREEVLELSLRNDPNSTATADAYAEIGFSLDAMGRGDEAIKAWQEAVRIAPARTSNTHYWLGKALTDRQRYAEALPILRATLKFYPEGPRHLETEERTAVAVAKALQTPSPSKSKQ